MNCPFCGSSQVTVANTRATKGETQIWRRRKCLECKSVFTSYEKIDLSCFVVEKKDGRRQRFNRAKLLSGVYKALVEGKGVDRGDMGEMSEKVVEEIEEKLIYLRTKVIKTSEIIEQTVMALVGRELGAALRYWSYVQRDSGLRELKKLIRKMGKMGE